MLGNPESFKTDNFFPLAEQYEAVYDQHDDLVVATAQTSDYVPDAGFLKTVRANKKYNFAYSSAFFDFKKEGVALTYLKNGKPFVAIVTAYDLHGYDMSRTLRFSLFFGNLLALIVIGVTGYFFSRRALLPFDDLIKQMDIAPVADFGFRIVQGSRQDEAASLASSFNGLLQKIKELADNQRSFISYASHELRTPLTVIKGVLETSLSYDVDKVQLQHSAQEAVNQVNHAIELSNNLLFLAEVDGLRLTVDKRDIDVTDLVMDSVSYIQRKYPSQPVEFEFVQDESTDDFQAVTEGIPHLLRSALDNIMDNACKYSDSKPIGIKVIQHQDIITISIADQGIGILPEDLHNVFMPMMRGKNTGSIQGFGIGLSLVKKIIDFHRGTFKIDSVAGRGTTVTIHLPLKSF